MRTIPEDFRARLRSGATTLAHAWRLTRRDGVVRGFTDHDEDIDFDGVLHRASTGLSAEALKSALGGGDVGAAMGVLEDDGVDAAGLEAGLWDGARVDVWRVDWTAPQMRIHVAGGVIAEVVRRGAAFTATVDGLDAPFDRPVGRVYARQCDADVGDARCGVNLNAAAYRGSAIVDSVTGARRIQATGLGAFEDGWFTHERIVWPSGARSEVSVHRRFADLADIEVLDWAAPPDPGTGFTITAGCDKRAATCRAKFSNFAAFRGFPHMPGTDALIAGIDQNQPRDGGSRHQ